MVKATKKWWPIFVLPTFAAFIIGFIVPFCEGLYLSFCKFTTINKAVWIGASNYVKVFQDPQFFTSLGFTALFTVFSTVLINVFAFAVALALTNNIKGTNVFRTIFFMPNLIGGIVLGYIWNILFNCLLSLLAKPLLVRSWPSSSLRTLSRMALRSPLPQTRSASRKFAASSGKAWG